MEAADAKFSANLAKFSENSANSTEIDRHQSGASKEEAIEILFDVEERGGDAPGGEMVLGEF
jgi:hypothetical protein